MSLSNEFGAAFEYILNSEFSLIQKYRKPKPLFEPEKNLFNFSVTEKYAVKAIRICNYNQNIALCGRYRVALEYCGFDVYTDFEGFDEIKYLYNNIFHNWHAVISEINKYKKVSVAYPQIKYKAFIDSHSFALLVTEKDQQFIFYMPLTARQFASGMNKYSSIIDYFCLYVLVPKKTIHEFSASDLYWEMLSHKIGRSMYYEHKELHLRAYKKEKRSVCIHDNLTLHIGMNHFSIKAFDTTSSFEITKDMSHENLAWLKNSNGFIFNSFREIQTFMFRFLTHDFVFLVNYYYDCMNFSVNYSDSMKHLAVIAWIDSNSQKNIVRIIKRNNILIIDQHTILNDNKLNIELLYTILKQNR